MSTKREVEEAKKFLKDLERYPMFKEKFGIKTVAQKIFSDKANHVLEKIENNDFDLGFTTRTLVQANLPHRDPGPDVRIWSRENGDFSLTIQPNVIINKGEEINYGFPFGNIPRLIMIYLCTQVVKKQSPLVDLGASLSDFMHRIGMEVTGGRAGTISRFKDQLTRLLTCHISFTYDGVHDENRLLAHEKTNIAKRTVFWWNTQNPDQAAFFNSYLELNEEFFHEIINYGIPINLDAVASLKNSPLAIDFYTWLTYRVLSIKKPTRIPWELLSAQMGANYTTTKDFRRNAQEAITKIVKVWPELRIEDVTGGIVLRPSPPHVAQRIIGETSSE